MSCARTVINRKRIVEALTALIACMPAGANISSLLGLINSCCTIEDAQAIFDLAIQRSACYLQTAGLLPFSPSVQLWDGLSDVTIDDGINLLRLTGPPDDGRTIFLPPVAGYTGGAYVALDLGMGIDVLFGYAVLPSGTDTIDGKPDMVPLMGAAYLIFTPSGTGNWTYQVANNDDPRFVRIFSSTAFFGGTPAIPDIRVVPASYNGNPTSWIGHDGLSGGYGGIMIPINQFDPLRLVDRFNFPIDALMRHPLSSNIAQPVPTLGTGAGTIGAGAEIAIVGNDTCGWVRVLTGADATGVGEIFVLPFDGPFAGAPSVIMQSGDDTTRLADADSIYAPLDTTTTTEFRATLPTGKTLAPSSAYRWRYHTFGGQ
jgi:hypothetical protein